MAPPTIPTSKKATKKAIPATKKAPKNMEKKKRLKCVSSKKEWEKIRKLRRAGEKEEIKFCGFQELPLELRLMILKRARKDWERENPPRLDYRKLGNPLFMALSKE